MAYSPGAKIFHDAQVPFLLDIITYTSLKMIRLFQETETFRLRGFETGN